MVGLFVASIEELNRQDAKNTKEERESEEKDNP
jgi:hypothetical protein